MFIRNGNYRGEENAMDELVLKLENVNKYYGRLHALKDYSLEFKPGIYGLLGPNGAGKSTLMKLICRLIRNESGEITWRGKDIFKCGKEYRKAVALMPQEFGFYPSFTGLQILDYFSVLNEMKVSKSDLMELLEKVNLSGQADKKVKAYSGGMKRRLGIALALLGNPEIMVFDEPTAGLDPLERIRFKELLFEYKKDRIILVSTHIITDIESLCDNICFMNEGRLVKTEQNAGIEENYKMSQIENEYMDVLR